MRFIVDESTGPWVAKWLREHGPEVFSVFEQSRGIDDEEIIQKAFAENWILITYDKDFGDKIFMTKSRIRELFYFGWTMNGQ
jgi:predicted nuclease of predicted toxin-antitoxin system